MKIRSSGTLIFTPDNGEITAFNYLTKSVFSCPTTTIDFLSRLDNWKDIEEAKSLMPSIEETEMDDNIQALVRATAIVEENSIQDLREIEFQQSWKWAIPAAVFHFSLNDKDYLSSEEIETAQLQKAAIDPSPALMTNNNEFAKIVKLISVTKGNELLELMARRRTVRDVLPKKVTIDELADCLFAGLGITGHTHNCVGQLPLSMTPSGGARNPIEAFVYARNVEGLERGFYHYSAAENSLGQLPSPHLPEPSELLAGQEWADEMPCIIFLAAYYERAMWKYSDPNAYRGVLIEAGHIGQNIMLSATRHEMTACPTAAFCHSVLHENLGLKGATQSAVYALALAHPDQDESSVMYH